MNVNTPSLNDLLSAIDNPQVQSKTKKDLDVVYGENSRIKKLGKVLEQHEVEELEKKVGYRQTVKNMNKYKDTVFRQNTAETLVFPEPKDVGMKMINEVNIKSDLSDSINKVIDEVGIEEQIRQNEKLEAKKLTAEDQAERAKALAKMRSLMFFEEIKARRQKKIKSKKYHRILKHDKEREKRKEMELLNDEDPEAAAEFERKKEKQRLEERITQRHKSSNWTDVRQAINEKDKIGKELSEKINKDDIFDEKKFFDGPQLDKNIRELLSQQHGIVDVDDDENEVDLDEAKAIAKDRLMLLEEIESKKNDGLLGMKFMQNARIKEMEDMKNILNEFEDDEDDEHVVVVDQDNDLKGSTSGNITIDGDLIISTEDDQKMSSLSDKQQKTTQSIINNTNKDSIVNKSNTKVKQSEPVVSSLDQIMLDIKNNKLSVDEIGMEEDDLNNQYQQTYNEDDINDIDIEFDDNDKENKSLKNQNNQQVHKPKNKETKIESTEPDNIMEIEVETTKKDEEKNIFQEDQKELLRLAFEGDDVMNELEEIDSANNKKERSRWGSWAGENVEKKPNNEKNKKEKKAKKKSILFNNKVDKKFIKYMVPELPKGYENQKNYKLHLNTSLGPEWTSLLAHKKLTRPEVVIRKGKNIAPLRHGKK
ncbi:U3 small nucleolar RNA-associated protein [Entamoeba marina]